MSYDPCSRCGKCTGEFRVVPGNGPITSPVIFVGERPGRDENANGIPFCGQAGKEFNGPYLELAGLSRPRVRVTNSVKCFAPGNRKPRKDELLSCAEHHLKQELELWDGDLVVLMGGTACSLVKGLDLETYHGIPRKVELLGVERWVFPVYHPALGLHDTYKIRLLRDDFERLYRLLNVSDYVKLQPVNSVTAGGGKERYALSGKECVSDDGILGLDTETIDGDDGDAGAKSTLWSGQLSANPGEGFMYLASDREAMVAFQRSIRRCRTLYVHNSDFDIGRVLIPAGFEVDEDKVVDSMHDAYHLGLPQGLKPLAYRLCGMEMQSYSSLVRPYSRAAVKDWLIDAAEALPDAVEYYRTKVRREEKERRKPNPLVKVLNGMFRSVTGENEDYNPWKRWKEVKKGEADGGGEKGEIIASWAWWLEEEGGVGSMPRAGIDKVPVEKAVRYGGRDADAGRRVGVRLDKMVRKVGGEVDRRDWDEG